MVKNVVLSVFGKKLKSENRNKVIIFVDDMYGIIDVAECIFELNVKVKDFETMEASRKEILERWNLLDLTPHSL